MANNRMYLECTGCKEADLLHLAKRLFGGYYSLDGVIRPDDWFEKHENCGDTFDHFRLVYECRQDYDIGATVDEVIKEKFDTF